MKINTIIFDMDGVIIDTEEIWTAANTKFLAKRGKVYDVSKVRNLINGKSPIDAMNVLMEYYHFEGNPIELSNERKSLVISLYSKHLKYLKGFEDFIKKVIDFHFKIAIATGADHHLLNLIDRILHLSQYFGEHMYSVEDVGFISKPDPATFLYAAERLDSKPSECIVIEDSPLGIDAANAGGMSSIGLTTSTSRDKLTGATFIIDSFDEIDLMYLQDCRKS